MNKTPNPIALAAFLACAAVPAWAQTAAPAAAASAPGDVTTLPTVVIRASADASAQGLSPAYPGGQVARGGRAGILGTQDNLDTPFSITAYTNELIQDRQARSVGDVLQNDPSVRTARGFGNFQESYFIRGFILSSDDVAYNGLYSLLPRQYIATELFERVEVLRGASAFLMGANPGGGGIGGSINLLPKRATNEPLTRVTAGVGSGPQGHLAADISRRFGPDNSTGVRVNAAYRDGDTAVDREKAKLSLVSVGADWHRSNVRLSGDLGWQDNRLKETRTNVSTNAISVVPRAPDASSNWAQPWSYSNEKDLFGTFRGEVDLAQGVTAWAAYGLRRSEEANSLANLDLTDGATGAGTVSRFDNTREDEVNTGELGLRGKLRTGTVGHDWVVSTSAFSLKKKAAYRWDFYNTLSTNLYAPTSYDLPAFRPRYDFVTNPTGSFIGNDLASPAVTGKTRLTSLAIGDTLSLLDDNLLLTLGARYQKLKVSDFAYDTSAETVYDQDRTSPVVGAVFKLSKQFSIYGNYIEGLTQGATLAGVAGGPPTTLAPSVSKQKEAGVKYDAGRLSLNLAYFNTSKPRRVSGSPTAQGKDEHQGVEFNAYGEAVPGLKLLGGATWLDTKQKNTGSPAAEGQRVIGVPRLQANVGAEWNVPAVQGLALDGRVVHTGASYADSLNSLKVPGWTRLDIGARYLFDVQGQLVTLRARIDNVTDKNYWASVGGYPDNGYLVSGNPRTFSLSASVDF